MSARGLMVLGTASHVGKSLITAGLGRIFSDDGLRVAPFKAQNMSLNSAATPDGREIGRAQALQAEACRVAPCAEMNPILIKPSSDMSSQVVLLGEVWGQVTASDYHLRRVEDLFPAVVESYKTLANRYDLILLEGAGSPAEINLRRHDIVNMRMAHAADAACLLVGDIDRGGVFASLLGTMELLEVEDRARIRAFAINKFRGDVELLRAGVEIMEKRLGIPCAGVVHHLRDVCLEEEDSVAGQERPCARPRWVAGAAESPERPLRLGVLSLPHMANFTDFDSLAAEPSVALAFIREAEELGGADVVIVPGTKQTLDDLQWLRDHGFADVLAAFEGHIIGICGGFQMLGISIEDPHGVESRGLARSVRGLAQLGIRTVMNRQKTVRRVSGRPCSGDAPGFRGYEIHMGETRYEAGTNAYASVVREGESKAIEDGAVHSSGRVWGTYIHGLFDDDAFRHAFVKRARTWHGLAPAQSFANAASEREARIDRWANHLRQSLDMKLIRGMAGR